MYLVSRSSFIPRTALKRMRMSSTARYDINGIRSLTERALLGLGFPPDDTNVTVDTLLYAELRGNNQGLIKLVSGALKPNPLATEVTVVRDSKVTAKLDGGQRMGMFAVSRAVDMAIDKARTHGIGAVGVSNYSSATGALGAWARKITEAGLVGIVMSQCSEMVAPHGSYEPIFGTNPIAIGVPTAGRAQILDMATSAEAWFGLVTAAEQGTSIRGDIAYDANGECTTSPGDALKGALRVFDRSYKGSHLALMIELIAGAMTGASMEDKKQSQNWGTLVLTIDPAEFSSLEEFQRGAAVMCDRVKNAKRLPGVADLYLPGERGDSVESENIELGSIELSVNVYEKLASMACLDATNVVTQE